MHGHHPDCPPQPLLQVCPVLPPCRPSGRSVAVECLSASLDLPPCREAGLLLRPVASQPSREYASRVPIGAVTCISSGSYAISVSWCNRAVCACRPIVVAETSDIVIHIPSSVTVEGARCGHPTVCLPLTAAQAPARCGCLGVRVRLVA